MWGTLMYGIAGYTANKRNADHKPRKKGKAGGTGRFSGTKTKQRAREDMETRDFKRGRIDG